MHELYRDSKRLLLITQLGIGHESFSTATYFGDFTHYYFSRFWANLSHAFKEFSRSEITAFTQRHQRKLSHLTALNAVNWNNVIVPIPLGMLGTYRQTLDVLSRVLTMIDALDLERDVRAFMEHLDKKIFDIPFTMVGESEFKSCQDILGKLYGKTGLSHATAAHVLVSVDDIQYMVDQITMLTNSYYQTVLHLNRLLKDVDQVFHKQSFTPDEKEAVTNLLMSLAHRLSIFAVVMDNLQSIEHQFIAATTRLFNTA